MNSNHVQALESKHASVDSKLRQEMSRPSPDPVECSNLKRQKLAIKDEIVASG